MSDEQNIRPSEIHAAWQKWCEDLKEKAGVTVSIDNCKWTILDAVYATSNSDIVAIEEMLGSASTRSVLEELRRRAGNPPNPVSAFDCDDVALLLRGRIQGNALARSRRISYCCGVAVLKTPEIGLIQFDQIEPMGGTVQIEHAITWLIVKDMSPPVISLKFVVIEDIPADSTQLPKISIEDAPTTIDRVPWGSVSLIIV